MASETAIKANLRLKTTNELVYPNTISDNVSLPDGSSLTTHVDSVKEFEKTQEKINSDTESWKEETDAWKDTHTHTMSDITDLDLSDIKAASAAKVDHALKITINDGFVENDTMYTFDGSRNVSLNLTPDKLGAAEYDHTHEANDITGIDEMINNKIQTIPPAAHTHKKSDITDLDLASSSSSGLMSSTDKKKLDGIQDGANNYVHPSYTEKSTGLYKVAVDSTGHINETSDVTKQDILDLGISGGDITYPDFIGATESEAGSSGLVPAPNQGETNLFLKSDGTWGSPSGNITYDPDWGKASTDIP